MTAKPKTARKTTAGKPLPDRPLAAGHASKLDLVVSLLVRPDGASLAELTAATGWQAHSVRGALAGSLKKKGHDILSEKIEGERRYRIGAAR